MVVAVGVVAVVVKVVVACFLKCIGLYIFCLCLGKLLPTFAQMQQL